MKPIFVIGFYIFFFALYGLLNYYIFIRGFQAIPHTAPYRIHYIITFIVVALSFFLGRILENYWLSPVSKTFVWIGSFWLASMLYFFIAVVLFDAGRLLNSFMPVFPKYIINNYQQTKQILLFSVLIVVVTSLIAGHINARNPIIKKINLAVSKKGRGMQSLNIVAASDIHLGSIIGKSRFDDIVSIINSLNPDIVLLPGDIVDEDLNPVVKENLGESLRNIKSKFGVFAVTGNHEYIGGVEDAVAYLTENGVRFLRDETVLLNHTAYLVGREDRSINRFGNKDRKSLKELISGVDETYPIIMMDHQPFQLATANENGIDLQLSGHTHGGQLWPLNFITDAVYELSYGYKKIGGTNIYVSCGIGTWGPPVRLGNRPEIVNIRLNFE